VEDLGRLKLEGMAKVLGYLGDYDDFLSHVLDEIQDWGNSNIDCVCEAVKHVSYNIDCPDDKKALAILSRIRLPYLILTLLLGERVDLPSLITQTMSRDDHGNIVTIHTSPFTLGGDYKHVKINGECFDMTDTFSKASLIRFERGPIPLEKVLYLHPTLSFHKVVGTPKSHIRLADHRSVVKAMHKNGVSLPEWLYAPYKYNPQKGHSLLDMLVYPTYLLADTSIEYVRVTRNLIWLWIYRPNSILNMTPLNRYRFARDLYGVGEVVQHLF